LVHLPLIKALIDPLKHAASAQVAFRFNSFIALALAQRLFGEPGLIKISILLGITIPLLNVAAVWPMAKSSEHGFIKELSRNPLVLATLSALSFNLLGLHMPGFVDTALSKVGTASIPLGLMAAGASLHLGKLREDIPLGLGLLGIRHAIAPLLAFGLASYMALEPMEGSLLIVFSALPTASSSFVLSSRMGFDGKYVAGLVTLSTLLGMASLSLAFLLIHRLY
jgi:predicted permease